MSLWLSISKLIDRKHADQWAFEAAASEVRSGRVREGLMIKATAGAGGDERKSRALYVTYLAEILAEEAAAANFSRIVANATASAKSHTSIAIGVAKQSGTSASSAFGRWGRAFSYNTTIAVGIALLVGLVLQKHQDSSAGNVGLLTYLASHIYSGAFWGGLIAWSIPAALIMIFSLSLLLCFQFMRRENGIAWGIIAIPICAMLYQQWNSQEALQHYQVQGHYDQLLSYYEGVYPQINPESDQFSKVLTDRVAERAAVHGRDGQSPEESLRLAMSEIFQPQRPKVDAMKVTPVRPRTEHIVPEAVIKRCSEIYFATMNEMQSASLGDYAKINSKAELDREVCEKNGGR